jgi:F-type H+-transporting ATPase subunit alpha
MAAFSQFASDLDASTQQLLSRGERLTELLKQKQYAPLSAAEQTVVLYAGVKGFLDEVAVKDITDFEEHLLDIVRSGHSELLSDIAAKGKLDETLEGAIKEVIETAVDCFGDNDDSGKKSAKKSSKKSKAA